VLQVGISSRICREPRIVIRQRFVERSNTPQVEGRARAPTANVLTARPTSDGRRAEAVSPKSRGGVALSSRAAAIREPDTKDR
jgi:hypothetical protein